MDSDKVAALTAQLDSFHAPKRRAALEGLQNLVDTQDLPAPGSETNLHAHTFFSFNAYGYSPTRYAWEARRYGMAVAGIVDFDVLDGVEEFLSAARLLRLKAVAGLETRVFFPELDGKVTNSPHEPGVSYSISTGFVRPPEPGTRAAGTLAEMAECAQRRNRAMTKRVNGHLDPVVIDYDNDVLPLTPSGNATERHMLSVYERRAREAFPDENDLARFWSDRLSEPEDSVRAMLSDPVALKKIMRYRLMKFGGVGYVPPAEGSFPVIDDVLRMVVDCGALPNGGWLDGTHDGEEDSRALFELWLSKGIPMVTIVPDRNWNLKDPGEKALKVDRLRDAMETARALGMPLIAGTEMNAEGQKFIDTFSAPELQPYVGDFLAGAHFVWGHTLLRMTADVGALGPWAEGHFGGEPARRNAFFRAIGAADYPDDDAFARLRDLGPEGTPDEFERALDCRAETWPLGD